MVYSVGREDAAEQLGISTRTIDRYIRKGKIRSRKVGKLVMLHGDDVRVLLNGWEQKDYEIIEPKPTREITTNTSSLASSEIGEILTKKMQEKDELIQELSYKLGKLETELKNSIPKIEHRKATLMLEEAQHKRVEDAQKLKDKNQELNDKLNREKNIATFFIICAFVLAMFVVFLLVKYINLAT